MNDEAPRKPVQVFAGEAKVCDAEVVQAGESRWLVMENLDLGQLPPLGAEWWVYDPAAPKT